LVHLHGGEIEISSELGHGTSVTVKLPIIERSG
jgi:signal transduction histidine kinase